jgi:hypothetical protein
LTLSPFYSVTATPDSGIAEYIVYLDAAAVQWLGPVLPDTFVFSLYWWLPTILVLLALPVWLQKLGVNRAVSWLSTVLIVLSPAVEWWSLWPLNSLAWSLVASLLLMWAIDRASSEQSVGLWPILAAAASGVFLARTALAYFPWAFPIAAAILIPTLAFSLTRESLQRRFVVIGVAVGVCLAVVGLVVIENWDSFEALANTVYPGSRRTTGSAVDLGIVFGAQHLGVLRADTVVATLNESEISTAYAILIAPTVVLLIALPGNAWRYMRTRLIVGSLITVVAVFFVWIMVDVPTGIGESIPLMNRIDPPRLAQIIGIPITILFAVALDRYERFPGSRIPRIAVALTAGFVTFAISLWAGLLLQSTQLPDLTSPQIFLISIVLAALISVVLMNPREPARLAALAVGALTVVVLVNPIMVGFGELRDSDAAIFVASESNDTSAPVLWATDSLASDALLMANAVPSLSGQQWTGPSKEAWMIFDPDLVYVDVWNRGTASIAIIPTVDLDAPIIRATQEDIINIWVDPCDASLETFGVTHMITSTPTESPCLTPIRDFTFGRATRFAYRRSRTGG